MNRPSIVVVQATHLTPAQRARLDRLGAVTYHETPPAHADEWLERVRGFDIICSGKFGLSEKICELSDVFISGPFVATDWIDWDRLSGCHLTLANAPGGNKEAVAEWVVTVLLALTRQLRAWMNQPSDQLPLRTQLATGLHGKRIVILGAGNIGTRVGELLSAFGAKVSFVRRSDDLLAGVRSADVLVDTRSTNPSTRHSLTATVFSALNPGSFFVTPTSTDLLDIDDLLAALASGQLAGAAIDVGAIQLTTSGDSTYDRLRSIPNLIATPSIGSHTDVGRQMANDLMIDNVEAWVAGEPINIVTEKVV